MSAVPFAPGTAAPASPTVPVPPEPLRVLLTRWREGVGSTYRTCFRWEARVKNFRSIRRGILAVVREIEAGTFGNV